jgi:hypothetical protein
MPVESYKTFDVKNLVLPTPEENKNKPEITKYQLMSVPQYPKDGKSEMAQIQGPWTTLSYYGITSKLDKNGKPRLNNAGQSLSDRERGKIKIPFDLDNEDAKKLHELLCSIDKKAETDKEQIFGDKKKAAVYKYQPIVRQAPENPDAPDDTPLPPDYFVIKFDLDYNTGNVNTKLFVNDNGERSEVSVTTVDDMMKYIRYKCEFRPVFSICKLFAARSADSEGKRKYGFGLKLKLIEVRPMKNMKDETETFFIDTDNEEEERKELVAPKDTSVAKETKTTKAKNSKAV